MGRAQSWGASGSPTSAGDVKKMEVTSFGGEAVLPIVNINISFRSLAFPLLSFQGIQHLL